MVVIEIAEASFVFDVIVNWPPEIFTSFPAAASISTPPAVATILRASSAVPCVFVIVMLSVDAVFAVRATSPAVAIVNVEFFPVMATPPTVDVNSIAASPVPCVFVTTIVSLEPWLVVIEIAFASFVLDTIVNWPPETWTSFPAAASISTPPAVATNLRASSAVPCVFVIVMLSVDAVFAVRATSPAVAIVKVEFFPVISTPPTVDVNSIAASPVPCVFVTTIVSLEPWLVVIEIAEASFVFDVIVNWPPEIFTSFPAAASISTPPAVATILRASSAVPCVFVIVMLSVDAVFAVRATSPAVAIVNVEFFPVMATPPTVDVNSIAASPVPCVFVTTIVSLEPWLVVIEIAFASFVLDTIVNWPPETWTSFPAAASISIPPAVASNLIADSFVPFVFVTTMVSLEPWLVVMEIAFASLVLDVIVNWPPEIWTSFPAAASISTPPATAVIAIAASSVPFVFTMRMSSFPAVAEAATLTYASKSAFPMVKSFSSATFIVIPPALAVNPIASLPVAVVSTVTPPVPASNSTAIAFTSTFVDASLPIVIVLAEAPEPILIFWATASLPKLITPPLELRDNTPAVSISNPVVPLCFKIASLWIPNLNSLPSRSKWTFELNEASDDTRNLLFKEISFNTVTFVAAVPNTIWLDSVICAW